MSTRTRPKAPSEPAANTREFAIATPHRLATQAGAATVAAGGTAVDAALAAATVLTVVYPHNCAIGGDLFALVRRPDGSLTSVNASGPAAAAVDPPGLRARYATMPLSGPDPITVPGVVAGWQALHERGARLPWARAIEPAIGYAREGVPVAGSLAAALAVDGEALLADPGSRSVFAADGRPLGDGRVLRQPRLAASLEAIAGEGPGGLYGGELGRRLVRGLRAAGSPLTEADLAAYRPEVGEPLRGRFRGRELSTSPPNSQGAILLAILSAIEAAAPADPLGRDADRLASAFVVASAVRDRLLADPRTAGDDLAERLLAEAAASSTPTAGGGASARAGGDTIAVVAADAEGHAVSLIQSVFHSFGARLLEPETGILMHNRGSSFQLDPAHPNAIAPGKRPAHTLMPLMVERDGSVELVLGTMGGLAHAQIHAQLLLRLLDGESPSEAVSAPRWIVGALDSKGSALELRAEEGLGESTVAALARTGLPLARLPHPNEGVGHAQVVSCADGRFAAGSDPRADGAEALA